MRAALLAPDPPRVSARVDDPASLLEDYDAFAGLLCDLLLLDRAALRPEALLHDDLGLDSLAMVEILAVFDRQGLQLPDELVGALRTVGDVYHYLCEAVGLPGTRGERSLLEGPNTRLRALTPRDAEYCYRLHTEGTHLMRYRLRAQTPSPEAFHRFLWEQALVQFLVVCGDDRPVGLVTAFEPDFRNRYAYLAAVCDEDHERTGFALEGMALLISYLFTQFDFRKLYAESLEGNLAGYASGEGSVFEVEGRLRGHEYVDGRYEDLVVCAIWREGWREHHRRVLGSRPMF